MPVTIIGADGRYLTRGERNDDHKSRHMDTTTDCDNRNGMRDHLEQARPMTLLTHIYGKTWEIRFAERVPRTDGQQNDGLCDNHNRVIWIRSTLVGRELVEVIAHELIHAYCWSVDEQVVTDAAFTISDILSQLELIRDN